MTTRRQRDGIVIVLSVALHSGLFLGLRSPAAPAAPRARPTTITLDVPPAPSAPPPTVVPPPAQQRPPVERRRAAVARSTPPAPMPSAAPPAPDAEAPVDLTGITLTDTSGAAWASAVGNGAPMMGPLAARRAGRSGSGGPPSARREDTPPALVAPADLGRAPVPPALEAALESEYPTDARRDGVSGHAVVTARVRPDGGVDQVRLLDVTAPGFGESCRRILVASRWSPPLDRDGRPCATMVRYTCRFEISH